ncbi:MAG: glycosyltransferase family 2 protein, partial [Conexivisphaera sp.]
ERDGRVEPMISIEIPTLGEGTLGAVLESVRRQTLQDYEVLVLDGSPDHSASDVARAYGARVIRMRCNLLRARYELHRAARGEAALLLDATRILRRDALEVLGGAGGEMVVAAEREARTGVLSGAIDLDRRLAVEAAVEADVGYLDAYVLPRYFSSPLLSRAMESLRVGLGADFDAVIGEDHRMIFLEALRISGWRPGSVRIVTEPLILHVGNGSIRGILGKSFRYGSTAVVAARHRPEVLRRRARRSSGLRAREVAALYMLYAIQYIGYSAGYAVGTLREWSRRGGGGGSA